MHKQTFYSAGESKAIRVDFRTDISRPLSTGISTEKTVGFAARVMKYCAKLNVKTHGGSWQRIAGWSNYFGTSDVNWTICSHFAQGTPDTRNNCQTQHDMAYPLK